MKPSIRPRRFFALWTCALMLALPLGWSGPALAQDAWIGAPVAAPGTAQLYELTENMKLISKGKPRRVATSQLIGVAAPGTPLCPGSTQCTINATGSDNVSLATGLGTLSGRFTVVVQGDNSVDGPEAVVMRGNFRGTIDFSSVLAQGFGTAEGTFTSDAGSRVPFTGTFRVPYLIFLDFSQSPPVPCDPTGGGNPYCIQVTPCAVYTDLLGGNPLGVEVAPNEYAIGYPTVRFDLQF